MGLNIFELLYIFTPINSSLRLSGNGHLGYLGCLENIKMKTSKIGSAPRHLSDCKLVQKIWCIWLLSFPINLVRNIFAFNEIFRFFGNQEQDLKPEKFNWTCRSQFKKRLQFYDKNGRPYEAILLVQVAQNEQIKNHVFQAVQCPRDIAEHVHNTDPCGHLPNIASGTSRKLVTVPGTERQCCGCPKDHYLVSYCMWAVVFFRDRPKSNFYQISRNLSTS